jgi:hypothetical protein
MSGAINLPALVVHWSASESFDSDLQFALDWWCSQVKPLLESPDDLETLRLQAGGFARLLEETGADRSSFATIKWRYNFEVVVSKPSGTCSHYRIDTAKLELTFHKPARA